MLDGELQARTRHGHSKQRPTDSSLPVVAVGGGRKHVQHAHVGAAPGADEYAPAGERREDGARREGVHDAGLHEDAGADHREEADPCVRVCG